MRLAVGFSAERLFDDIEGFNHDELLVVDAVIVAHYACADTEAEITN